MAEFLEQNAGFLYPLLGVVAFGLILLGVVQSWRGHEMSATRKTELKKEIVRELRKTGMGLAAEAIGRAIGLETFKTQRLLEEMQAAGIVVVYTNTERLSLWQLTAGHERQ